LIRPDDRPALAPKARLRVDEATGEAFLLYPERGLKLNSSAAEILRLCDSHRSVSDIVALLSARAGAEGPKVASEVADFLASLSQRGLLEGCDP
jgi:coenzyme PQQ biosynthesis protein PqqD